MNERLKGKVIAFNDKRGYGFIKQSKHGEQDLFVHFSNISGEGYKTLKKGDEVEYDLGKDNNNRDQALNVTISTIS